MSGVGTRAGAISQILKYLDDGVFEEELRRRVAIPTESQKANNTEILDSYLTKEMIPAFEAMGFENKIYKNPFPGCGSFLLATRHEGDDLPTTLGYGHGDVILGQDDQWTKGKGPWELAKDGDRIYGRGTADNKAQHTINIAALRAVLEERGKLGFNVKYLIEMGEENGCRGLKEIIAENKADFKADVFIGSDGPRVSPRRPTLTLGSRGALNFNLSINLREGGHHSGNWGGLIADPATILSHAIASIVGPNGQIKIKDWLPPPTPDAVYNAVKDLVIEAGPGAPEIDLDWGEPGMTPAQKVYSWNSFAVLAMKSGNPDNPVNAISPSAWAQCQLRYFAGTKSDRILPALREHLAENGFPEVQVSEAGGSNAGGFGAARTEPDHPWVNWVKSSARTTIGEDPAILPSMGGSIGNDLFIDFLGLPAIWVPHSYAACSQHAPNEHILSSIMRSALPLMAGIYWDLGDPSIKKP